MAKSKEAKKVKKRSLPSVSIRDVRRITRVEYILRTKQALTEIIKWGASVNPRSFPDKEREHCKACLEEVRIYRGMNIHWLPSEGEVILARLEDVLGQYYYRLTLPNGLEPSVSGVLLKHFLESPACSARTRRTLEMAVICYEMRVTSNRQRDICQLPQEELPALFKDELAAKPPRPKGWKSLESI